MPHNGSWPVESRRNLPLFSGNEPTVIVSKAVSQHDKSLREIPLKNSTLF